MTLVGVHTRYQLLETIRIPVAMIGSAFFPAVSMLFFVVPYTKNDPVGATLATASMVTFAVMVSNLFQYGVGVSTDRAEPWDPYTRTLPAGPLPRLGGRVGAGLMLTLLSLVPVLVIAAVATPATVTWQQLLAGLGAVLVAAAPFALMGLTIGYALPSKAALAVAQLVFFPLAFGGGLLSQPGNAPGVVETIAPYLPTRGAAQLLWAAVSDFPVDRTSTVMLAVWTVALGAAAVWAYRRDEGRRFR